MKRNLYLIFILALVPAIASALGLGRLDLSSALNEPFEGKIELLSPTADELDSLNVGLADNDAFARANIDRPFNLSKLKFALRRSVDDGPDYIRVFSSEPIREPFLNFLIEIRWSKGRLFREYTVLLDPPLYDPNLRASEFKKQAEVSSPVATIKDPDHAVVYSDDFSSYDDTPVKSRISPDTVTSSSPQINYGGGDYGPTVTNDTLWSIASAMRPDSSVSVNQMMMALLRSNPDAFINNNINGLKRGQVLRMPNESEINALNNAQALSEAQSQHAVWSDVKDSLSSTVDERPEESSVPEMVEPEEVETSTTVEDMVETDPELKLVAADDTDEVTDQAASVDGSGGQELILAQETIQALTQENIELKDQLQESEAILDDLKRLLSLKDDELAVLQEQLAAAKMAEEAAAAEAAAEEMTEEVMEEEPVEEIEEMAEEVMEEEAVEEVVDEAEEMTEEVMEEVEEVMEEEVEEIIETESVSDSAGIMDMVSPYLAKAKAVLMSVKDMVMGNMMVALAAIGVLIVLIVIIVVMKFRKGSAEVMHIDAPTEEAFPDFDSGDLGDMGEAEAIAESDSESVTVLPGSEDETVVPGDGEPEPEFELGDEKTQFVTPEATPELAPEEEEDDEEDPLQEVNTYLAFEQFDQAEELVRNAINDDPDNAEYHTKLLEVFYTSGNKKAYEVEAKVLHDKVGGEGEHWNMATAMWQEMSPSRPLFEEGGEEDDDSAAETTGGGFVDVTADDEAGETEGGGLDFDIGGSEEASDDESPKITGSEANENDEVLDISSAGSEADDLLDVTAAASLEDEVIPDPTIEADSDEMFDVSASGSEDLLDISSAGGEDLLDVTSAANIELDSEEDLLDVTAVGAADSDEDAPNLEAEEDSSDSGEEDISLDFDMGDAEATDAEEDVSLDMDLSSDSGEEDISLDLDMGDAEATDAEEDVSLDMDLSSDSVEEDISLDLDMGDAEATDIDTGAEEEISMDMDLSSDSGEEDVSLDLDMGDAEATDSDTGADDEISLDMGISEDADDEISLDMGISEDADDDGGIELDLSADDEVSVDESADLDLGLDASAEETSDANDMDFDLDIGTDSDDAAQSDDEISLDMSASDDDDDDHTVFVPRSAAPEAQSEEDETATKLDLAKAYVELGDSESAKSILDEVIAEGNDEQKKQAEELLAQT